METIRIQIELPSGTYDVFSQMDDIKDVVVPEDAKDKELIGAFTIQRIEQNGIDMKDELMEDPELLKEIFDVFMSRVVNMS